MAQAFDEPFVVVGLDEDGDPSAEIVHVLEEARPEALLLDGPHEAFGHAVALGLSDEGGIVLDAQPVERALEVVGPILAAPVVAELDPPGDVGFEAPEAVDDGVVDGLESGELSSVPQRTLGASVMIRPSWTRGRRRLATRWGASSPAFRIRRSTRFLPTWSWCSRLRWALTLRWPSPAKELVVITARIFSVSSTSEISVFGPGRQPSASPRDRR
jgi:hypothetical protein